jgi:hypothetical protein
MASRAAHAGDDREPLERDVAIETLEVVLSDAAEADAASFALSGRADHA